MSTLGYRRQLAKENAERQRRQWARRDANPDTHRPCPGRCDGKGYWTLSIRGSVAWRECLDCMGSGCDFQDGCQGGPE